jgi:catalase
MLSADGVNDEAVIAMQDALVDEGAIVEIVAPRLGTIIGDKKTIIPVKHSFFTTSSVLFDAVYVPGGINSVATLASDPDAVHFLNEAYRHCKPIAADLEARQVIDATYFSKKIPAEISYDAAIEDGIAINEDITQLITAFSKIISLHRFWHRETNRKVPA